MNSKVYKSCAVPQCVNTTLKNPKKLFVYVPNNKITRYKWLKLARRDPKAIKLNTCIYFCEDHFDLPNSMENFMEYHVMGSVSQVRMKPGCMPSKFECQPDRRKRTSDTERPFIVKKQRQTLIEEAIKDAEEKSITTKHLEIGETSSGSLVVHETIENITQEEHKTADKSIQVYMTHKFRSKAIQTGIKFTPDPVQVPSMPVPNDAAEQSPRTGRPRVVEPIKVTSGPSLKSQAKIALDADFNPVITDIKSEADLIKQEKEDPQSDDTVSLADDVDDADQPSDAEQPSEDLIPLSNAQVPLSNAPDPLSDVKVEEVEIGVGEVKVTRPVEVTRPVKETRPVELTKAVELITPVEDSRSVEESRLVELTSPVEETSLVEETTVRLPLNLKQELSRAGNDCYNLIRIQANQINKLSVRCGKQRLKLHSYTQLVRRRDKRISYLRAELAALRSFIEECGWEASSSGEGKIDVRRIQIRSSNTVVGQKKPNRQLLIVKRDYKLPKSSVSAQHTSDTQTSTVGDKRGADILLKSFVDSLHTSDNRRKSSVGVKCTIDIQEKSSVSIPATSDILEKSSVAVKRTCDILQRSSSGIPATSGVFQNSTVGVQRTLDTRQKSSVSIPDTSNVLQKSTDGVKRPLNIQEKSSVSIPGTSDGLPKSATVGVKRILDIRQKLSSGIPITTNVLQKSTDGVKRISDIKNNPSIAVQPVSVVSQTSVGFQRTSDVRQHALVIQIDGMHNTVLPPKLVRLDDNSMETG